MKVGPIWLWAVDWKIPAEFIPSLLWVHKPMKTPAPLHQLCCRSATKPNPEQNTSNSLERLPKGVQTKHPEHQCHWQ